MGLKMKIEEDRMRIAVIGTGGIGRPMVPRSPRRGGRDLCCVRGAHLAAIRENGLRIEGDRGETHIRPAQATDDRQHRRR
jgi:2-dehydropantoate 2-reductase